MGHKLHGRKDLALRKAVALGEQRGRGHKVESSEKRQQYAALEQLSQRPALQAKYGCRAYPRCKPTSSEHQHDQNGQPNTSSLAI